MTWVIVAVVMAVAIGPIFWLLPSKRDKRLAEFRSAARRAGLVVEIASVPDLHADPAQRVSAGGVARDAKIDCAAYRLPLQRPLPQAPCWQLLKSERGSAPLRGWIAPERPTNLPLPAHGYWRRIGSIVDALPGDCVSVQADARMIAWFGREHAGDDTVATVVEDIRAGLDAISILHHELNASAMHTDD